MNEDPETVEYARLRLIQMSEWQQVLLHGSDDDRRALVASLREVDLLPALSVLAEDEEEVRVEASRHRTALALAELQRLAGAAIRAGDLDTAARLIDLRLSVEDASYRDNGGRVD